MADTNLQYLVTSCVVMQQMDTEFVRINGYCLSSEMNAYCLDAPSVIPTGAHVGTKVADVATYMMREQ